MAYSRFPSKESSFSKALSVSLGWRVFLLSLALVVLPLVLFSCLVYFYVAEVKRKEVLIEFGLVVEDQKIILDQKIADAERLLQLAKINARSIEDKKILTDNYKEMVSDFPQEIIVLSENTPEFGWINVASSESELLQKKPLCEVTENDQTMPMQSCTWKNRDLILFSEPFGLNSRVSFFLPFQEIIKPVERLMPSEEQVSIRLLKQGQVMGTKEPKFNEKNTLVIPYEEIEKMMLGEMEFKIPNGIDRIATALTIDNTPYALMIDFPLKLQSIYRHLWRLFFWMVWLLIGVGGILVFWLTHKMVKPLKNLATVMRKVEKGILDERYEQQPWGFEINQLGVGFNQMLTAMMDNIREREKQRIEKELLSNELEIGHAIQKNLFPSTLPELPQFDIATLFQPANKVAGDFYDLFLSKGTLLIVMADAAGKGVSACLYALLLRGMLRSLVASGKMLDEIVKIADQLLHVDTGASSMFITAWIGLLDVVSMDLSYVSLGHFPALLRRGSSILELDTEGGALGVEANKKFAINHLKLQAQDLLLLYTDGFAEAFHKDRHEIAQQLKSLDEKLSSAQILEHLIPPPPYEDDLTLAAIRIS